MADIKQKQDKKGIVLLIVIGTVFIVIFLASAVLSIITSHSRLTHHQVSRIQAYYAAMAGVNYALEQLRTGTWVYRIGPPVVTSCPDPNGCLVNENDFPTSIRSFDGSSNRQFRVIFCPSGATCQSTTIPCNPPPGINFCVNATINYTYTHPTP